MAAVLRFHTRIAIVHGCLQDFEIAECVKEKRNASFITLIDNGLLDPAAGIAKFEGEYLEGSNESQKTLRASINNVWQFLESAPTSSAAEQSDTLPFHLRSKFLVARRTRGFLSLDSQAVCSLDEKLPPSELSPKIRKPDWTEVHPWFAKCATLNRLLIASIICVVFYFSWMLNPIAFMQWIKYPAAIAALVFGIILVLCCWKALYEFGPDKLRPWLTLFKDFRPSTGPDSEARLPGMRVITEHQPNLPDVELAPMNAEEMV